MTDYRTLMSEGMATSSYTSCASCMIGAAFVDFVAGHGDLG